MSGDGKHDLYEIIYDPKSSSYVEQGYPDVDFLGTKIVNDSNNIYTFMFTTFPRTDLDVVYSIDKINYDTLHLSNKKLIPFIEEADIRLTKKQITDGIIIKVKAKSLRFKLTGLDDLRETDHIFKFNEKDCS